MFVKVLLRSVHRRFDSVRITLRIPVGRANFTVRLEELHSLNEAQCFVHGPADWQIVDRLLTNCSFRIDNKGTAQRNSGILNQHIIVGCDFLRQIRQQRILESSETTLFSLHITPSQMAEMRVDRYANNFGINRLKVSNTIAKRDNLGGTYKSAKKKQPISLRLKYTNECPLQI